MSIVPVGRNAQRRSDRWARARNQQGTGIDRSPVEPGRLTPEQCDRAVEITWANARAHTRKVTDDDGNTTTESVTRVADAAQLLSALGLIADDAG